ncbi:helix-turn-helix domain-containing protein [Vitiosangium sp. GDMCC 1.1324]|uniref:helix-turn-helix domain-containing protein n=1 Tax=Vitiosangium sp. (strain GDMCC 1.1324) TaxID=2138576 RepID=UPI000D37DCD0|nr:helix-turn-helix transcriptional regulator [Vitiosangium sp. GDMCC 1.1324]PTL75409.1 XRE family transcriptional regulator [Vitiosangium sp. GDMCC 1.1324]
MPRLSNTYPPKRLATNIGEACRAARVEAGLTQEDVADRVGIATEVYGRLERGNMTPSVPTLRKVCLVLNLSADAALAIDKEARLPPRPPATDAGGDEGASPEHRRLIRRTKRLPRRELRILGVLATILGEKGGTPSKETTSEEEARS